MFASDKDIKEINSRFDKLCEEFGVEVINYPALGVSELYQFNTAKKGIMQGLREENRGLKETIQMLLAHHDLELFEGKEIRKIKK